MTGPAREDLNGWKLREALAYFPISEAVVPITYRDPRVPTPGNRRLGNTHHRLWELLASWCERDTGRHCHYSVAQLASLLHVGENWTRCCLRDLEGAGLLQTVEGGGRLPGGSGRANEYWVKAPGGPRAIWTGTPSGRSPFWQKIPPPAGGGSNSELPPPAGGGTPDVKSGRTSRVRARDGMRFASPAGSARDDFLSSRASLGPGNGGMFGAGQTRAEKEEGLRQLLTQYRVRCPRCSKLM